jgi:hypothetical protein
MHNGSNWISRFQDASLARTGVKTLGTISRLSSELLA